MTSQEAFDTWWTARNPDQSLPWEMSRNQALDAFMAGWNACGSGNAGVAQLAEQAVCSGQVAVSTTAAGSTVRGWWQDEPAPEVTAEQIWAAWPVKKARGAAIKAIEKAMKAVSPAKLLEAVNAFRQATDAWPTDERQFIPMCSTWMNQERWADDRSTWQRGKPDTQTEYRHAF